MKDALRVGEPVYSQERKQLVSSGWCAQLLRLQGEDGLWNRSLYSGKWISTTYSLYLLKLLGLPPFNPQALKGCNCLLAHGLYRQQEIRLTRRQEIQDLGVSALVLSICCYFGLEDASLARLADFLIGRQCDAGNWLPNESPASAAYTFETTLIVLEGLLQFSQRFPAETRDPFAVAVAKGQEFLLKHNLYLKQGKPIKRQWTSFSFPLYWFYDVLTALDYFYNFQRNKDHRLQSGIDLLRKRQNQDGSWALGVRHAGKSYFEMETPGKPSRWNTLRALRVLEWWHPGDTQDATWIQTSM